MKYNPPAKSDLRKLKVHLYGLSADLGEKHSVAGEFRTWSSGCRKCSTH